MSHKIAVVMPVAHGDKCRENLPLWHERGYDLFLMQDRFRFSVDYLPSRVHLLTEPGPYVGWPKAVNKLARIAFVERDYDVVIAAGDDMRPDPKLTAQQMAERYLGRFPDGFGVMQPIGDDLDGTDRICGSPIVGRGWGLRAYGGASCILWPEYWNFYADEELLNVSRELGVLWQDRDTTHYHDHWTRRGGERPQTAHDTQRWWDDDKRTFERRKAARWPHHEPAHKESTR